MAAQTQMLPAEDWSPSKVTQSEMDSLVAQGLLRPNPEEGPAWWVIPSAEHREPHPPEGYVVSFTRYHRMGLGVPPSRFMRGLAHHFEVELQHFSPNSISHAAIFAAVCEGYLKMEPHWEMFVHLFRGELFIKALKPSGRRPVRMGSLAITARAGTSSANVPREYLRYKLSTNQAGWDDHWFYLRNEGGLLPQYTGRVLTQRPEKWTWGVAADRQRHLAPLMEMMKTLVDEKKLTVQAVIWAFHQRRVLPLADRPLLMHEMGPQAHHEALNRSRMAEERLSRNEGVSRVSITIQGPFVPELSNLVAMAPDEGCLDLVNHPRVRLSRASDRKSVV